MMEFESIWYFKQAIRKLLSITKIIESFYIIIYRIKLFIVRGIVSVFENAQIIFSSVVASIVSAEHHQQSNPHNTNGEWTCWRYCANKSIGTNILRVQRNSVCWDTDRWTSFQGSISLKNQNFKSEVRK